MSQPDLDLLLDFFKALAHASRLRIVALLADRELRVTELAEHLGLEVPTVSHHLRKLEDLGLVTCRAEGTARVYRARPERLEELTRAVLAPAVQEAARAEDPQSWERKVLGRFVQGDRVLALPASRKKREVVLRWVCDRLPVGVRLGERAISEQIAAMHEDTATIRRELVGLGWLEREQATYWRPG